MNQIFSTDGILAGLDVLKPRHADISYVTKVFNATALGTDEHERAADVLETARLMLGVTRLCTRCLTIIDGPSGEIHWKKLHAMKVLGGLTVATQNIHCGRCNGTGGLDNHQLC